MCQCSKDRELLLTSSSSASPPCALWSFGDVFEMNEDTWVKSSNLSEHRIIGTHDATAHIYDTATGQRVLTLHDSNNTNNYSKNLASFNPTDDLVLNDGVLWDVKGKRVIHKFDKFNNFVRIRRAPTKAFAGYTKLGGCVGLMTRTSRNPTKVARKMTMSMTMMMRMMMMTMRMMMMTTKLKSRYLAMMIRMMTVILQSFEARLLSFHLSVVNSTQQ
nr:DDB1- and CUL4-associated factor 1-like isoform X2 [Pocillopora verrucosa]